MRQRFEQLRGNNGFTLTELIVTIAVSAVLLSASVAGIVAWVHHADFVRNENYAETIYYAAQTELTRYRGNGQLAELEEYVRKENLVVPVNEITDDYRATLTGESALSTYNEKYDGRLYYLMKEAGPADRNTPLGGWLSDYIYDGSIMDGAICIEFDPVDGTVYSVSYSDRNDKLTYIADEVGKKTASLLDRSESTRKKERMGYYSVELSEAAPDTGQKTRMERVELVNEEQLYLRWTLPEKYRAVRGFLSYTLQIYRKNADGDGELEYTFTVKGSDLKEKGSGSGIESYIITCQNGNNENDKYQFIAYMDNGAMCLVFDSIDYGVDPEGITVDSPSSDGNSEFNTEAFKNSASVLQLFAEPEDIYVKVQAQGRPYKASAWKQSNTSNTLFASMDVPTTRTGITYRYEIKNARHLYNIRYREQENSLLSGTRDLRYQQTADVVWMNTDEKLFHSISMPDGTGMKMQSLAFADKCTPVGKNEEVPYFLAIPGLGEHSVLEVPGRINYELKSFVLYQANPDGEGAGITEGGAGASVSGLGLVVQNGGIIQGLTVTDMYAEGVENVGAVCGVNSGKIWSTTVSGIVTGVESVGGIAGLDKAAAGSEEPGKETQEELENSSCKYLINYAEVTGSNGKVGGIIGSQGKGGKAYLCENYGVAKGADLCTLYIGGIAGYNEGLVQECVSAPDDKEPAWADETGELEPNALKGIFVGGIVGCNNGGIIKDSGTEAKSKDPTGKADGEACIIGYRYVGGIVGYNKGMAGTGAASTLVNTSTNGTNKAKVIGHDYVGGIVGANGLLSVELPENIEENSITAELKENFNSCEIEEEYSADMVVEKWTNEGIVVAAGFSENTTDSEGRYAGGIAGYNAGKLVDCTTKINTSSSGAAALIDYVRLHAKSASYVGGVAGCNIGYICSDNNTNGTISVNSVVAGKKYVGGIVGYNGTAGAGSGNVDSGKIENYALSGGYITGESYVGGYAGLNTTEKLLGSGNTLSSNPNEVTADYFAGGVMGALILVPENNDAIIVNCATDNFFGSVTADNAFAGGYVGYTQLLGAGENAKDRAEALYTKLTENSIKNNIKSENEAQRQSALQALAEAILDERETEQDHNTAGFQFTYEGDSAGESRFASVKASVFAGGVIGANSWNTKLLLQNINNKVQVTATDSVAYEYISSSLNMKDGSEEKDTFSFAGGIMGLVTPKAKIERCSNSGAGNVEGKGTYAGGIAEVNLGTIQSCTAGSVSNRSYYGGIAGLNTNDGKIIGCVLDGQISGEDYLGGMAACNESIIQGCIVKNSSAQTESAVIGTGKYIGGIAAVSRIKTVEEAEKLNEITNCTVAGNIGAEQMGEAVGGLVGRYEGGSLSGSSVTAKDIYGLDHVGGIAGEIWADLGSETAADMEITNHANVSAAGLAGGIGGELKESIKIAGCRNTGKVRSTEGLAGGIVPEIGKESIVEKCLNGGSVEALSDPAGGIAARNSGRIENCSVESGSAAGLNSAFSIMGKDLVGGIAGENHGRIEMCSIKGNVTVSDINASGENRAIGGIAGRNAGVISGAKAAADESGKRPQIITLSQKSYLGGIAGTNIPDGTEVGPGKIEGGSVDLEVRLNKNQQGTVGGAAGANAGTINGVTFSGAVEGTAGSQYGTGGITGRNELAEANMTGSISNCILENGEVKAISEATGFGGHSDSLRGTYVGGICGVNPENGIIENCSLRGESEVSGDYGYVGGIVAYNLGEVKNNGSKPEESPEGEKNPRIYNSVETGAGRCVMGGIAGYNGATGILENCITGKWTVINTMNGEVEICPTGGVIGCNKSVYDQRGLTNYADVSGNWMSGGIIGLQQTEQRSGFMIENCINYGMVTGSTRAAGGIIADWRVRSGGVRECLNYGEVSISGKNNLNGAGGIIGTSYGATALSITIERCGNEGKIIHDGTNGTSSNGAAGGIFGVSNPQHGLTLTITDCYNAAEIQNANGDDRVSAGICAGDERGGDFALTITRCVNYGRGTIPGKTFAGIVSKHVSTGRKIVEQCLEVGECYSGQRPIAKNMDAHEGGYNYYFSNPAAGYFKASEDTSASGRRALQVAKLMTDGGQFGAISGTGNVSVTEFDVNSNRLYLDEGHNKYLQFTNVQGTYSAQGNQKEIEKLKDNFSAYGYRKDNDGIDDRYTLLLFGMERGTFGPPQNVNMEEADSIYKVTFSANPETLFCTAGYELEIWGTTADGSESIIPRVSIESPGQNIWSINESELFAGKDRSQYTELWVQVRAVKADNTDYAGIAAPVIENGKNYSAWAESDRLTTKPKLPTPKVHFEVTDDGSEIKMCGYWVLDNVEDYEDYGTNWEVKLDGVGNINPLTSTHVRSDKNEATYTIDKDTGPGSPNNITVTAYARPTGDAVNFYSQSDNYEKMLSWYQKNRTLKAELADSTDIGGFVGTKEGELSYRFRLKESSANYQYVNITCMAEFLFDGEKIGEGTVVLPNLYAPEYCTIDLSDVDQDTIREIIKAINDGESGKKVEFCFYPWEIEELKYYVTDDNTKEIITRTIPAATAAGTSTFNNSYISYSLNGLSGYDMYPEPAPGEKVITEIADDSTITHTLYWDAVAADDGTITPKTGEAYDDAEYTVTVTGKAGDTEVVLYNDTTRDHSIKLLENNWKYEYLVLNVERLGKEPEPVGGTHYIGASANKTYSIPIRLSSVSKPNAKLRDRHNLIFDVSWMESAETGAGGYRLIINGKDENKNPISPVIVDVGNVGSTVIDLDSTLYSTLKNAREIEFSIVVVSADTAKYLDSRESASVLCEIPLRLSVPKEKPELTLDGTPVGENDALKPEEFVKLALQLTDATASSEDAAYEIEYFVAGAATDGAGGALENWDQTAGEKPGADPATGIYISTDPVVMVGNLQSAYYMLNQAGNAFNAEQAGRILWYRIRAVSNSKVSSEWTEWKRDTLPKVLLSPVEVPENQTVDREYSYALDDKNSGNLIMRQPKLSFAPVEYAAGYEIYIKEADRIKYVSGGVSGQGATEETVSGDTHRYTLKVSNAGGAPFVLEDDNGTGIVMTQEGQTDNGETIWSGSLYSISLNNKVSNGSTDYIYAIEAMAKLCCSVRNNVVQEIWLELPEGEALNEDGTPVGWNRFIATASVDITVISPDAGRYVVEEMTRWARDADDSEKVTIGTIDVGTGHNDGIAVVGYFGDDLNLEESDDEEALVFVLDQIPDKLLPEDEISEEEKKEEEEETESDDQENDVSGNDVSADNAEEPPGEPEDNDAESE